MNTSEFDDLLRREFGQHEFAFNPDNWSRLHNRMQAVPPRRRSWRHLLLPGIGLAAAVLATGIFLLTRIPASRSGHALRQRELAAVLPAGPTEARPLSTAQPQSHSSRQSASLPVPSVPREPAPEKKSCSAPGPVVAGSPAPAIPRQTALAPAKHVDIDLSSIDAYDEGTAPQRHGSLSLGGGVHYGALNTGYAIAVNARRSLGRKMFIEGDFGVVSNAADNASRITPSEFRTAQSNSFSQGITTESRDDIVKRHSTNLYYMQFAPAIGYQLSSKLSIGAGPDLQQLLQRNDRTIVGDANADALALIPDFDFGILGKTEYRMTRRLKAGLQYREGLNNLFRKSDDAYFNRRYVQVQVKYLLLGN